MAKLHMGNILEIVNLRVGFPVRSRGVPFMGASSPKFIDAVCGVSFKIAAGETFALVGESGSGKTTLALSIAGLAKAHAGSIKFESQELSDFSEQQMMAYRRDMAFVFQDPIGSLSPRFSVKSLIVEPFKIHGLSDRDLDKEASRLLNLVGLTDDFADRYPHQLSGGQARRVGVARALALSPKLIIADEPTAGLDVSIQGEILNLLSKLKREMGISLLIITHNLSVVRHIADRMAIMYLGRFVEQGATEAIFAQSHHPYTQALLSAVPEPDPDVALKTVRLMGEVPSILRRPTGCEFHTRCPIAKPQCQDAPPTVTHIMEEHSITCHFPPLLDVENQSAKP